jgi:hypothetical protein
MFCVGYAPGLVLRVLYEVEERKKVEPPEYSPSLRWPVIRKLC